MILEFQIRGEERESLPIDIVDDRGSEEHAADPPTQVGNGTMFRIPLFGGRGDSGLFNGWPRRFVQTDFDSLAVSC